MTMKGDHLTLDATYITGQHTYVQGDLVDGRAIVDWDGVYKIDEKDGKPVTANAETKALITYPGDNGWVQIFKSIAPRTVVATTST